MTIIGITGFKRSGKNTVGDLFAKHLPGESEMISFAGPLKEYAYDLNPMVDAYENGTPYLLQTAVDDYGWEEAKDVFPEVRKTLQRLGTEVFRKHVSEGYWPTLARESMIAATEAGKHSIITDVRFPNEAVLISNMGGTVIRVVRSEVEPDPTLTLHASEAGILQIDAHIMIVNDGTLEDLEADVKRWAGILG